MKCAVCGRYADETYKGIYEGEVVDICPACAEVEKLPIIKKPTNEQISKANERYSVRETMERISGFNKMHTFPPQHATASKNLGKLRIPIRSKESGELVQNYHWKMQMARRNSKLTIGEVSRNTGVAPSIIMNFERGILPENFQEPIGKIENFLMIRLLKKTEGLKFETAAELVQEPVAEQVPEKKKFSLKGFFMDFFKKKEPEKDVKTGLEKENPKAEKQGQINAKQQS